MTSGGRGWRGGAAPRRNRDQEEKAGRSWRRVGRRAAARGADRPGGKRLLRIGAVLLLLTTFVAAGILIFKGSQPVHTHFVTIDLLRETPQFSHSPTPDFPADKAQRFSASEISSSRASGTSFTTGDAIDDSAAAADVLVVYVNLLAVPGPQSEQWCVVDNGTPDLRTGTDFQKLSALKDALASRPDQNKLLLVDLETGPDWRLGVVSNDVAAQLKTWPEDISRLVIVVSSADAAVNWKAGSADHGRTVFGSMVQRAFTQAADTGDSSTDGAGSPPGHKDDQLTVMEFCRFVSSETDAWVKTHRSLLGQQVQVFPPTDELVASEDDRNFLLMKNLPPEPDVPAAGGPDTQLKAEMIALWERREALETRSALLWHPMLWRSATEALLEAQRKLLNGQSKVAAAHDLSAADKQLTFLESTCPQPEEISIDRGLRAAWFQELPASQRLRRLWGPEVATTSGANDWVDAERVLAQQLDEYPFERVGMQKPSQQQQQAAVEARGRAEDAVAGSFGMSNAVRTLIADYDQGLLASEDSLFVDTRVAGNESTAANPGTLRQNADTFFESLREHAEARQQALATLSVALDEIPGLTSYSAAIGDELRQDLRETFLDALQPENMSRLPASSSSDHPLPTATVDLIRGTERLIPLPSQDLSQDSPASLNDVRMRTEQLREATHELSESLAATSKAAGKLVTGCIEDGKSGTSFPEQLDKRLALRSRARRLLELPQMTTSQRTDLLTIVTGLDAVLQEASAAAAGTEPSAPSTSPLSAREAVVWNTAWMLQTHRLLATASTDTQRSEAPWAALTRLRDGTGEAHEESATLSRLVREHWIDVREQQVAAAVTASGKPADRIRELEQADLESRLLISNYDVAMLLDIAESPTTLATAVRQLQYCLLHADRAIQSRWLAVGDGDQPDEQHWYARLADEWLSAATRVVSALSDRAPSGMADLLSEEIQQRRNRLESVMELSFDMSVPEEELALGASDNQRLQADISISGRNDEQVSGTAAVRILSQSEQVGIEQNSQPVTLPTASQLATRRMTITSVTQSANADCGPVPLATSMFFRGAVWSGGGLLANPCPPNERTIRLVAQADTGAIVVDGKDVRPIMFVLDWSGSMNAGGVGRHDTTLNTLEEILASRSDNDRAGLIVYGHRVNGSPDKDKKTNPDYTEYFKESIPNISDRDDVEVLLTPTLLNRAGRQKFSQLINDKLRKVSPWGSTPLGLGLIRAANAFAPGESGLIIAITDGAASDIGDPQKLQQARVINVAPDLMPLLRNQNAARLQILNSTFQNNSHAAVIVALDLEGRDEELDQLKSEFKKDLKFPILNADNDKDELYKQIEESLDPRNYDIKGADSKTSESATLGTSLTNLPADDFTVTFAAMKLDDLVLRGGDFVRLKPDWPAGRFRIDREQPAHLVRATLNPAESALRDSPTLLRAMSDIGTTDVQGNSATALLTVMLDHDDVYRPVRQPAEIQFNIEAIQDSDFRPDQFTQTFTYEYGAPGWTLTMSPWPKRRGVLVNAVWKMQRTVPDDFRPLETVLAAKGRENAIEVGGTGQELPAMLVWSRQQGSTLQIVMALKPGAETDQPAPHHGIRVEIGVPDALNRPENFKPRNWTRQITLIENGAVENAFTVTGSLDALVVSFTSPDSLRQGATQLPEPLVVDKFDR